MRLRNIFRRKCCAVPFVSGHLAVGGAVSGIAEVNGMTIEFVGVVVDPDEDVSDPIQEALSAAEQVLGGYPPALPVGPESTNRRTS